MESLILAQDERLRRA